MLMPLVWVVGVCCAASAFAGLLALIASDYARFGSMPSGSFEGHGAWTSAAGYEVSHFVGYVAFVVLVPAAVVCLVLSSARIATAAAWSVGWRVATLIVQVLSFTVCAILVVQVLGFFSAGEVRIYVYR